MQTDKELFWMYSERFKENFYPLTQMDKPELQVYKQTDFKKKKPNYSEKSPKYIAAQ